MKRLYTAVLWCAIGGVAVWALVRLFGWETTWYGDTAIAFTPWVALAAILPVVLALVTKHRAAALVGGVGLAVLAVLVVPRAFGGPDPGSGPRFVVMSANLRVGGADAAAVLRLAHDHHVDVLAVQELTPEAAGAFDADTYFPYRTTAPYPYALGVGIYSRYPLSATGHRDLAGGFGQQYATIAVPGARPLDFESVHTRAPVSVGTEGEWAQSFRQQPAATPQGAVRMLAGDFNATLDHRVLRDLIGTGYRDVAAALGQGFVTTWPYDGKLLPKIALDHVLADPRIGAVSFDAYGVPDTDHRAIIAVVTLPGA